MRIVFLGAPGVGKGTYASRISLILEIPHIATGDLFRDEIREGTELGKEAKEYMERGELVPDELVIDMLKKRINEKDCERGFILDGFPRTVRQAEELETITRIDLVVNINLREELLIKKLAARRICRKCGKIYNIADIKVGEIRMPPLLPKKENVCDNCGGELYQRADDHPKVIEGRFEAYERQTKPLIEFYKKRNVLRNMEVVGGPDVMVPKIVELIKNTNEA
jgi:adenylate kinase